MVQRRRHEPWKYVVWALGTTQNKIRATLGSATCRYPHIFIGKMHKDCCMKGPSRALPKLNVVGSSPITRFSISLCK